MPITGCCLPDFPAAACCAAFPQTVKKPGKKLRQEVYRDMLKNIDEDTGFCALISRQERCVGVSIEDFKELMRYKPLLPGFVQGGAFFWFPLNKEGLKIRKKILNYAIMQTDKKQL